METAQPDVIEVTDFKGGLDQFDPPGDTEVLQLANEPVCIRQQTLETRDLRAIRIQVSAESMRRGSVPEGGITVGITAPDRLPNHWCGDVDNGDSVLKFPREEFIALTRRDFEGIIVTIGQPLVDAVAETFELDATVQDEAFRVPAHPDDLTSLRRKTILLHEAASDPFNTDPVRVDALSFDLASAFLTVVAQAKTLPPPRIGTRRRAFDRARGFIEAHAGEPLTIRDVSRAASVSARTLEYAFRDHAGLAPKAYLKMYRLNGVWHDLRRRSDDTTITDIANHWGFWHMGQFAADFRRMFGVLPSEVTINGKAPNVD